MNVFIFSSEIFPDWMSAQICWGVKREEQVRKATYITRTGSGVWVSSWTSIAVSIRGLPILRPQHMGVKANVSHNLWIIWGEDIMTKMPVTEADFNLQGRVENYRE